MEGFANEDLIKIANDLTSDSSREQELEWIRDFKNTGNPRALKKLRNKYMGRIIEEVEKSGLTRIMDNQTAHAKGVAIFDKMIKENFNPDMGVLPITYIYNTLPNLLKNEVNDSGDNVSRRSRELNSQRPTINIAKEHFVNENGRNPTARELNEYIHKNMKYTSGITEHTIARNFSYDRNEFSGSQEIGSEDTAGNASVIRLGDMVSTSVQKSGDDLMREQHRNQLVDEHLSVLDYNKKKFVKEYLGFDGYQGPNKGNLGKAALNNSLTAYEARNILKNLSDALKRDGVSAYEEDFR